MITASAAQKRLYRAALEVTNEGRMAHIAWTMLFLAVRAAASRIHRFLLRAVLPIPINALLRSTVCAQPCPS